MPVHTTEQIGKLEWGFATTAASADTVGSMTTVITTQRCHGFYPPFLFENGELTNIQGNTHASGKHPNSESAENMEIRRNASRESGIFSRHLQR